MKCLILFGIFVTLTSNAVSPATANRGLSSRIIGGNETTIKSHPYFVAILFRGVPVCGGAFLRTYYVITTASCISAYRPNMIQVQFGSSTPGDGEIVPATNFYPHPQFTSLGPYVDYDVAIISINKYISTSTMIQPISIRSANFDIPTGRNAVVVGFGTSSFGGPRNKLLQALPLPRVRDIECQRDYTNDEISDRMVCFGYPEGQKDSCNAGGSPLVYENTLIGLDSWSYGCAFPNTPRVFTRLYNEEIQQHIKKYVG